MALPEEDEPNPEIDPESPPPPKVLPFVPRQAPDWLTGPGDDVRSAAEVEREAAENPPIALPEPVLLRPAGAKAGPVSETSPGERAAARGDEGEEAEPKATETSAQRTAPSPPAVWAAAASSLPVPKLALPSEPEKVEEDDEDEDAARRMPADNLPGGKEDRQVVAATPALAPLREPWWLIALDALRSDLRVQIGAAVGIICLAVVGYLTWPQGVDATPLSRIRRHPAEYDGRTVVVRGRVGDDVFTVGSGWAFFLTQGRDTIVAFTRTQAPRPHESVTVKGQVSTGFLDGMARQALFEDASAAK